MRALLAAVCSLIAMTIFAGFHLTPPHAPVLTGVKPDHAFPGQIVLVEGRDLQLAQVIWDGAETGVQQSQTVTNYFQVPHDARPGSHTVSLRNSNGSSLTRSITVLPLRVSWPAPRIEDIGINSLQVHGDNTADLYLAVSAANVDPNAQVFVNSVSCSSTFYSAIPSDFLNSTSHKPEGYGYPVFHYGMLVVYVPNQKFEQTLNVRVNNVDGAFGQREYAIPGQANLDSDGDGLLDDWEINGYPVPGTGERIMLSAMGCNPHHKDILVQVDWMRSAVPNLLIWPQIESIFAAAPVLNPDGSQGISLHIDRGQNHVGQGPFSKGGKALSDYATIDFCDYPNFKGHTTFKALKDLNFDPARTELFHYCIVGNARPDGSTGRAEIWGDDFMVTFAGTDPDDWTNPNAQIGTFIHELGHNLGLYHGGWDRNVDDYHERFKWNQLSSMNYRYQLSGVPIDPEDLSRGFTHTYSEGIDTTITESQLNAHAMGVDMRLKRPAPSWSAKGMNINAGPVINGVIENWNPDEKDATDVFTNYDEWGSVKLDFHPIHSGRATAPCSNWDTTAACNKVTMYVTDTRKPGCGAFRLRLDGSASEDGGLCAPPAQCGISFPCVPPGDYRASALSLCDSSRFYWTTSDTAKIPNDTTNAGIVHFDPDSVKSVTINLFIQ